MKIILFLNNDIHAATALSLLLPTLTKHEFKIILSQKVGNVVNLPQRLVEMGELEKSGVTRFLDSIKKCDSAFAAGAIASYANVNSEEAILDFQNFAPDLFLSIRFGQIFKQPLINLPRYGILNLHSGILPDYRGVMASFWAILNGEQNLGTTLHYISDSSIDTGGIISFSKSEIDWESSLILNINNLYQAGCKQVLQALEKISANEKITTLDQKTLGAGRYFSYPKEEDVQKFLTLMPLYPAQNT